MLACSMFSRLLMCLLSVALRGLESSPFSSRSARSSLIFLTSSSSGEEAGTDVSFFSLFSIYSLYFEWIEPRSVPRGRRRGLFKKKPRNKHPRLLVLFCFPAFTGEKTGELLVHYFSIINIKLSGLLVRPRGVVGSLPRNPVEFLIINCFISQLPSQLLHRLRQLS